MSFQKGSTNAKIADGKIFISRNGLSIEADEAFYAWTSKDIDRLVAALDLDTHAVDRHLVLLGLVGETYKRRNEPEMAELCASTAEMHIQELPNLIDRVRDNLNGYLPTIPTFQQYSTLLTERGEFSRAKEVCRTAMDFGLSDGTKGGFEGRIKRIEKLELSSRL